MFESLTHWFESIDKNSRLFDSPQDETLQVALAAVLFHVIHADGKITHREKANFASIFRQEFDLNDEQIEHLYDVAKASTSDLHTDLHTVNRYLKPNSMVRMHFLQRLLELSDIGGLSDYELDVFNEALLEVFPECKPL